ncbi:uncharacterized protein EV154DRAFT_166123 [Mucor mucedo]|uniref:uncharacterized protein n=1 Tax=Mucor mucedo TaxID=29922 RepID=UPI00221F1F96|nr:uncharacterized protein EV154DRAFT_166123 [Mucor mucedo]KAI7865223.1 hypothetical protein EV154DRAFT_166123 [Mucor mucedo]
MLSQDQRQIRHTLARLALAKAIKTPDENEPEAEPWTKSIIFNQPFLKQLQKQQHQQHQQQQHYPKQPQQQQQKQYPPQTQRRDKVLDNKLKPQDNKKNRSSLVIEKKMSELSIKKHAADAAVANRAYLPSDSEEDDDVDDDDDNEDEDEDEDDDDKSEDGSEVIKDLFQSLQSLAQVV